MNEFALLSSYALALGAAALIPGPGMTGLMFKTLNQNSLKGFIMLAGLITGDLIFLGIALLGLNWIGTILNGVFNQVLIVICNIYLLYLAYTFWRIPALQAQDNTSLKADSDYVDGLLLTLSNPKTISFYLALLPAILGTAPLELHLLLLIVFITLLTLLIAGSLYIAGAAQMQRCTHHPFFQHILLKGTALIMIAFAFSMIFHKIQPMLMWH
ncbi:hypothetical protein B9T33_13745 [Acinetobacter sp. ANC 5054]|uniref:LysE family translocator n=1 Tax=Acinetobacter sp. ANC 5054 TaxID=1977877 RepID=UPI000A359D0F|nr:LysE family translocator [Acinetobacter sp. ANC 5054]OTG79022.1 hypothetical protein B9T33_13745 [Acinetobacter sp. ANC 5054]